VQLSGPEVDDYADALAALLERYGVVLTTPGLRSRVEVIEDDDGSLSFELIGSLPDGAAPLRSSVIVRERFRLSRLDRYERDGYEYELVDRERSFRRAFHLHDAEWFQHRYLVLVHEHCEQPMGTTRCEHHQGPPVRDGFAGVVALIDAWTGEPTCDGLRCLD
jgi:hypothetical protein